MVPTLPPPAAVARDAAPLTQRTERAVAPDFNASDYSRARRLLSFALFYLAFQLWLVDPQPSLGARGHNEPKSVPNSIQRMQPE